MRNLSVAEKSMLDCNAEFDDGRGRFPDKISVNTPKGLRHIAREVAREQGLGLGEFVRRALARAIESAKAPQADGDGRR
jgi:hypothetical protein